VKATATDGQGRYAAEVAPEARAWFSLFREVPAWVVVPHMRPDADTLGSALAMAHLIRRLGNRAVVVCADPVLARFPYLPGAEQVLVQRLPDDWPADSGAVTLDAAELDRLGAMAGLIEGLSPLVNLDHHISNQRFGTHNWIDLPSAATGELVYLLYDHFGVPVDREAAVPLYAALATDTGLFRYPATTPRTLEIAAQLLRTGISFPAIVEAIYERLPVSAVRLMGLALAALRLEADGKVAWTSVTAEMFRQAEATDEDAEGIVEKLREIGGVEVFYILRETPSGAVRVSVRSKNGLDVNAVARHFGGGGHLKASGCTIALPLPEAERQLRAVVLEHLERFHRDGAT
jgi:phosphoesterase RecJ-like protein